jgi:GNAT superfamily N-acetyltransferase
VRVEIVDRDRTQELRRSVLRSWLAPSDPMPGDDMDNAVHFAAVNDDGDVLSTCFVFADDWPFPEPAEATGPGWHLRQMATDPVHRGQGAGSAVVQAVITFVDERGGVLWCHAREVAFDFYARHGFVAVGDLHGSGDPPIPHKYMYRRPGRAS